MRQRVVPELSHGPVIEEGRLRGACCRDCGKLAFLPGRICPECGSEALDPALLSSRGTLYSWSVLHIAARGWEAPYIVAYLDLPEGVRVFGHVEGIPADQLRIDMTLAVAPRPPVTNAEGQSVLAYRFEAPHA